MSEATSKYQERTYFSDDSCVFRKTKELFGGLSNMASGFPLTVNGIRFFSSEALYQACRFPHLPQVQSKIISERSPMSAKMVGKPFRNDSRLDWDVVRIDIMYWCLRVKLAQNFISFGQLIESTHDKPIVEDSSKDAFWGTIRDKEDYKMMKGVNALGRLLMKLRQEYNSPYRYSLLFVPPPPIDFFCLYGEPIKVVDERDNFVSYLKQCLGLNTVQRKEFSLVLRAPITFRRVEISEPAQTAEVSEPVVEAKPRKKKQTVPKQKQPKVKKTTKKTDLQPELPIPEPA